MTTAKPDPAEKLARVIRDITLSRRIDDDWEQIIVDNIRSACAEQTAEIEELREYADKQDDACRLLDNMRESLIRDKGKLIAEIKRLRGIKSKLPITEDGHTILPGMTLWHIERGMKFANGSQAYCDMCVTWLGWHTDRRKKQHMYFAVDEEINDYYDGRDWFFSEYEMLKSIGDTDALDMYLEEQAAAEAVEAKVEQ